MGLHGTRLYRVSRYLIVLIVLRALSVSRVLTVTMVLRDSIPSLNLPLYYFSGFQSCFESF